MSNQSSPETKITDSEVNSPWVSRIESYRASLTAPIESHISYRVLRRKFCLRFGKSECATNSYQFSVRKLLNDTLRVGKTDSGGGGVYE